MGISPDILIGHYEKVTTELRNRKEIHPHSSKVEHSTDNRKTKDRYLVWVPNQFRCSTAVVQLTVNQLVVGSIPTVGAKF